ncbi:ABC transporter permease [Halobellus salinisoli]|uniref:ABC transporter permease n=1 Tax=Halobellus salinisoli TaxID=3108500 RepID=UPI0030085338
MSSENPSPSAFLPDSVGRFLRGETVARKYVLRVIAVIVALVLWDQYASTQPTYFFPATERIAGALVEQYYEYNLVQAFLGSMWTLFVGFALAVLVGIPTGLLMGTNRYAEVVLDPYVTALYIAPIAALVPLLVFAFGASFETRVAIVFLFAVFEIIIDTYKGAKATPKASINVARSFGASRLFVLRKVVIPYDMPYIFTGLRLAIGRGLKGLVLAELLINFANLGAIIRIWQDDFRLQGVLAIALLFMLVGIVLTKGMQYLEQRFFYWGDEQ